MQADMFILRYKDRSFRLGGSVKFTGKNPETLREGFDISIAKWEFIHDTIKDGEYVSNDGGFKTCGLCMLYFVNGCSGCPIKMEGHYECDDTPYDDFLEADGDEMRLAAARSEINFLIDLRKKYCGDDNAT